MTGYLGTRGGEGPDFFLVVLWVYWLFPYFLLATVAPRVFGTAIVICAGTAMLLMDVYGRWYAGISHPSGSLSLLVSPVFGGIAFLMGACLGWVVTKLVPELRDEG